MLAVYRSFLHPQPQLYKPAIVLHRKTVPKPEALLCVSLVCRSVARDVLICR